MAKIDKPRYYKIRRRRAFFELGARADTVGMKRSIPLGPDGDAARAAGHRLYIEWREKAGRADFAPQRLSWPAGSLGHFFDVFRTRPKWAKKSAATRAEWEHVWTSYLGPRFGAQGLAKIEPSEFEDWAEGIEAKKGEAARWRAVKIARALFNAAVKYKVIVASPALTVANSRPAGRSQRWSAPEVNALVAAADALGKSAMSLAIRIGWETAMQPTDVRTLSLSMLKSDAIGAWIEKDRDKTGAPVVSAISRELHADILGYLASLGAQPLPDAPILRTSRDARGYLKTRFIADFDLVRKAAFGDAEARRFQDIRRSANLEAAIGGATAEQRAEMLANALDKNVSLERTYTPATVERSRKIAETRLEGRRWLARQSVNMDGGGVKSVGTE